MYKANLALVLAISASVGFGSHGYADESVQPSKVQLQGQAVAIDVTLNDLRDARLSINRVRKAASNLYDEVTRQQVTMNFNPNIVGTTVIMTPAPTFTGQFLPARKKWVDASIAEMGPIIKLFKEDVDAAIEDNRRTDLSASARKAFDPIKEKAFASVKTSSDLFAQLESLTNGNSYDNPAIADKAKALDSQMKDLDRTLKSGISVLQKDAKNEKKNSKSS